MPEVEIPIEKWSGKVKEVKIGGGGRKEVVVGGQTTLPFLKYEGSIPNPPKVAIEVRDIEPAFPSPLASAWGDALKDPGAWAKKAAEFGADLICVRLISAHPENANTGAAEAKTTIDKVLSAVDLPLIIVGPGVAEKDNQVLAAASEVAKGQRVVLGNCEEKNFRQIGAVCISDGHVAIAKTPLDINLCKQLNIMLSDLGVPADSILMDPDTGALGYGIEYGYSINERLRLAALGGDAMTSFPIINQVGSEVWRQKEARAAEGVPTEWGDPEERGIVWETVTATAVINAGCDIVVMSHPRAVERVNSTISKLMGQ